MGLRKSQKYLKDLHFISSHSFPAEKTCMDGSAWGISGQILQFWAPFQLIRILASHYPGTSPGNDPTWKSSGDRAMEKTEEELGSGDLMSSPNPTCYDWAAAMPLETTVGPLEFVHLEVTSSCAQCRSELFRCNRQKSRQELLWLV